MVGSLCRGWARCQWPVAQVIAAQQQGGAGLSHRLSAPQARLDFVQDQGVIIPTMGRGRGKEPLSSVSCCHQTGGVRTARAAGDGASPSSHLWAGSPGLAREKWATGAPGSLPCPGNPLPAWHCLTVLTHGQTSVSPTMRKSGWLC